MNSYEGIGKLEQSVINKQLNKSVVKWVDDNWLTIFGDETILKQKVGMKSHRPWNIDVPRNEKLLSNSEERVSSGWTISSAFIIPFLLI